jgi:hypothetical protein
MLSLFIFLFFLFFRKQTSNRPWHPKQSLTNAAPSFPLPRRQMMPWYFFLLQKKTVGAFFPYYYVARARRGEVLGLC